MEMDPSVSPDTKNMGFYCIRFQSVDHEVGSHAWHGELTQEEIKYYQNRAGSVLAGYPEPNQLDRNFNETYGNGRSTAGPALWGGVQPRFYNAF